MGNEMIIYQSMLPRLSNIYYLHKMNDGSEIPRPTSVYMVLKPNLNNGFQLPTSAVFFTPDFERTINSSNKFHTLVTQDVIGLLLRWYLIKFHPSDLATFAIPEDSKGSKAKRQANEVTKSMGKWFGRCLKKQGVQKKEQGVLFFKKCLSAKIVIVSFRFCFVLVFMDQWV